MRSLHQVAKEEADHYNRRNRIERDCRYETHPIVQKDHAFQSQLQHRHDLFQADGKRGLASLPDQLRRYYLFLNMEQISRSRHADAWELSMVGQSCWTPEEKERFFCALERCSRHDIDEIARRVGPTKTVVEVAAYIDLLDTAAKGLDQPVEWTDAYSAREMSPLFILQEQQMAHALERTLETETHAKHQTLLIESPIILDKALELFEVWQLSSLTRLFSGINDMTVLVSTIVQMYELLKRFLIDMIAELHAELVGKDNRLVTRACMNRMIAKYQKTRKDDVRLKQMDIASLLDGDKKFHQYYTQSKSASFLAKRRRMGWIIADQPDQQQTTMVTATTVDSSDDEEDEEILKDTSTDDEEENDTMLKPIDEADGLPGFICTFERDLSSQYEDVHVPEAILDISDEQQQQEDEELENRMQVLDQVNESTLTQSLGFYDAKAMYPP
ncbi:hypothetical protein BD560DRAFT_319384 [Blakeslea trispora]|nr:hypothetical protein BD560DRAFT_319384 [Blakeslea trispora]